MSRLLDLYRWFWHDVLRLPESISWTIVHSMAAHTLAWQLTGSAIAAILWSLLVHFVALR